MTINYDLTNQRFGRLVVLSYMPGLGHRNGLWKCVCDCGNTIEVYGGSLRAGCTKSCGCLRKEKAILRSTKHGGRWTNLYDTWHCMKTRCLNKNYQRYKDYGGRGIKIHPVWVNNFSEFRDYILNNLGDKPSPEHSLDRINNDGNYEPGNLRWAMPSEQCNNRRSNKHAP